MLLTSPRINTPKTASESTGTKLVRGGEEMTGRSGKAGTDGKGDAEVEFVEATGGGADIIIVPAAPEEGSTDGETIDASARELIAEMEIDHCRVTIKDHAAPAWVARARLEAAIKRSGVRS
jgi:citrate lyase gamma subunit